MRAAVAAGAGMINDVYALRREGALEAAAALGVPVVLMHMLGEPRSMQDAPRYDDVVADVHRFLAERIFAAEMAGIAKKHIVVDPGFGFGKTIAHNLALLAQLERFTELGVPVLAGLSRKKTIGELTGRADPHDRMHGSVAAHLIAAQRGAMLLRVHDVAATVDALKVWNAVAAQPMPKAKSAAPRSAGRTRIDQAPESSSAGVHSCDQRSSFVPPASRCGDTTVSATKASRWSKALRLTAPIRRPASLRATTATSTPQSRHSRNSACPEPWR